MTVLIAYILRSIIASGILYAWYLVALRNRKFHVYNRVYLLSVVVISLILPFADLNCIDIKKPESAAFNRFITVLSYPPAGYRGTPVNTYVIITCMTLVSLFLLTVMILKISRVYHVKRIDGYVRVGNVDFIRTSTGNAPFSFLNNLFWREDMSTTDSNGKRVFRHEMTHIRQRHTYDKLFVQVIACIGWMNPFYWLIRKELNVVHEFMADAGAVEEGDTGSFAMMLLQCHDHGRYLDPSHYFFQSPVLRRLNMVASPRSSASNFVRKCLVLPLISSLLILFSFKLIPIKNDDLIVQRIEKEPPSSIPRTARTFYITYHYWTAM
jgi:hypothetical protein